MNLTLKQSEWALGLFQYPPGRPEPLRFGAFYALVISLLKDIGAPPTYIAAEGQGYSGELVKFGGSVSKRLIGSGFEGLSVLSIVTNPQGSKEPSYDRYVSISLSFNAPNELLGCIVINDGIVPFCGSSGFLVAEGI